MSSPLGPPSVLRPGPGLTELWSKPLLTGPHQSLDLPTGPSSFISSPMTVTVIHNN